VDVLEGDVDVLEGDVDVLEGDVDVPEGDVDVPAEARATWVDGAVALENAVEPLRIAPPRGESDPKSLPPLTNGRSPEHP